MLKFFRKHARGWFMSVVLFIIIAVFVLYFGSSRGGRHTDAIFIVDKKAISEAEFDNEYKKLFEIARMNLKEKLTPEALKKMDLKKKAYDNLMDREIIIAKAGDLKIQVSDEELKNYIVSMPILQTGGRFDQQRYQQLLRLNRMTAGDFEALQRTNLTANKIESFVREGVKISDKEIYDTYVLQNQKINVDFLRISGSDVKKRFSPAQSELEEYLKHNSNQFRVAEQTKIKYLFLGADSFSANISNEDIKNYYSSYKNQYLGKDGKPMPLANVQGSIIKELKKTRGMQTAYLEAKKARDVIYQEDNMEDYGKKNNLTVHYSDFFPVNKVPSEFSSIKAVNETLLDLQKKDVSKVLTAENGYYLIQVIDKKAAYVPKLDTIENEVRQRYIESETKSLAEKEAKSIIERIKAGESFEKIASEKGLKISETGFFQPGNTIPKVGQSTDAPEILIQLSTSQPYVEKPLYINDAYFILKLKETSKPDEKAFETQKEMYRKIFISLKQEDAMKTWLEGNKAAMIKEKRVKIKKKLEDLQQ
jgi:peptidyl-prolyl cis-trans isomerase D